VLVDGPLTATERSALNIPLAVDFPGAAELRIQASAARIVGSVECGCPTVDLTVDEAAPLADVASRVPIDADVVGAKGVASSCSCMKAVSHVLSTGPWTTSGRRSFHPRTGSDRLPSR
jgi:hypothetical protein